MPNCTARSQLTEFPAELYNESIPCSFQEPRFTSSDIAFLTGLGHEVIESPAAFEAVDEETLVFAIHMYRPIYEATLEKAVPAMFVGTGWDVWDECVKVLLHGHPMFIDILLDSPR